MRSSFLATIPGFRQRIIPEPRVPSRGWQARGTRLRSRLQASHCFDGFQSYLRLGLTHFELTVGQEMEIY